MSNFLPFSSWSILCFSSIVLFLLELFRKPLFIPSGVTKGNQVTVGHYKEIFQSSTNEPARKYWDFTIGASKTLGPWGKLENLMHILWGPLGGLRELGLNPFAAGILPSEVSLSNKLKLKGVWSIAEVAVWPLSFWRKQFFSPAAINNTQLYLVCVCSRNHMRLRVG